jgi:integrase
MRVVRKLLSDEKIKKIFELRDAGLTFRQIVKETKISESTINKYLKLGLEGSLKYTRERREADKTPPKLSREEIIGDEKAKLWLDSMDEGTYYGYMIGVAYFCAMAGKKPHELIADAIKEIKTGKLLSERNYFFDFKKFESMLRAVGFAAYSQSNYITAVRSFYGFYDIEMPKKKGGRKRKIRPLKENSRIDITRQNIKELLDVSKTLRDKALVLAVASSGLGRAEIRLIDIDDFLRGYEEETGICILKDVWRVKTGNDFISFFSAEASAMIWQYLEKERGISKANIEKHRGAPLFTAMKDTWRGSKGLTSRLAPGSIDLIFRTLAIRIDPENAPRENGNGNTIYNRLHPHNIRKFFNTEMKNAGMPEIMVEFIMGHGIELTKAAYYLRKNDEIKEKYLRFMPTITIQPTETQVIQSAEFRELKDENEALQLQLEEIREQYGELKSKEKELQALTERFRELEAKEEELEAFNKRIKKIEELLEKEEKNPTPVYDRPASFTRLNDDE